MTATDIQMKTETATHSAPAADESRLAAKILVTVLFALIGWGLSIATWGIPGLYIPALAMVPVMMGILLLISRG
jgi:fatty acid desaturase